MTADRVLVSTHDLPRAGALRDGFAKEGYKTDLVTPSERLTNDESVALVVLTGGFDDDVNELAHQAQEDLHVPVFAISESDTHVQGLRAGYEEVFTRSASVEDIVLLGRRVIERKRLRKITGIVGQTDAMYQVLERVVQIAPVGSTVLVTGESGTGKELVARGIHALSPRRHKPFIAVNVAAISETLLESEIFGHEKGSFTGAIAARKGLFELADGGTIFLDEIGDMPLTTQTKLLRVLEQREFHRVGGESSIKVDVRIVAATNQDLRHFVAIGQFRRDLYFRLNVLNIELPALRDRREDIPLLVESFVREVSDRNDRVFPGISPAAMDLLTDYSWPGNIRELRNLVESMVVLAPGGAIRPEDLPADVRGGRGVSLLPVPMARDSSEHTGVGRIRPELEFVFRTLVELRVDMDDLRRDFDAYRGRGPMHRSDTIVGRVGSGESLHGIEVDGAVELPAYSPRAAKEAPDLKAAGAQEDERVIVFRPGMTIEDMERQAIANALKDVHGNRRKAAELLGIGERTLYRKISKYGLED